MENRNQKQWYIVQTYSGKEDQVKKDLIQRITSLDMQELIFQVIAPEETYQELQKDGTYKEKVRKIFPGYVYVEMIDTDESWWVVRNTPQVTGFLGSAGKKTRPVPVPDYEMQPILENCGLVKPPEVTYKVGDTVTVIKGTFKDQTGVVESIDFENKETVISIDMFNRPMSVPVGLYDIEVIG